LQAAASATPGAADDDDDGKRHHRAQDDAKEAIIDDNLIYAVTAMPHPRDLDRLFHTLQSQNDLASLMGTMRQMQVERGLALADIVRAIFDRMCKVEMAEPVRIFLTKHLADVEYRLGKGAADQMQAIAVAGAFVAARTNLTYH
jgi:hypothetical protein